MRPVNVFIVPNHPIAFGLAAVGPLDALISRMADMPHEECKRLSVLSVNSMAGIAIFAQLVIMFRAHTANPSASFTAFC